MATTITVQPNQSMYDVILQATGSLEAKGQFCVDNNVAISDVPKVGHVYVVSDAAIAAAGSTGAGVVTYLQQNKIVLGTLASPPPLEFAIVLYPITAAVADPDEVSFAPSFTGAWLFGINGTSDFISVYGLAGAFMATEPNTLKYGRLADIVAGSPPHHIDDANTVTMTFMSTPYDIAYSTVPGGSHLLVWNDTSATCLLWQDVAGNQAQCTPFVIFPADAQTPVESLLPSLLVEKVTGDDTTITLRLTMSHVPPISPEIKSITMLFQDEALGIGTPDPLDPTNVNKCIVVVGAGTHLFGAVAMYIYTDGHTVLGLSVSEMCVEVS